MTRPLLIVGSILTVIGLVMIPLPGPGFPLLALGLVALVVGAVAHVAEARDRPRSSSLAHSHAAVRARFCR